MKESKFITLRALCRIYSLHENKNGGLSDLWVKRIVQYLDELYNVE